ncbi:MAG: efflux RND transporter periplasmic adaptor subunit [Archangium sp.]|nr:efflux RND transporter periplasmic adaptor subunit [Archangium sp.]
MRLVMRAVMGAMVVAGCSSPPAKPPPPAREVDVLTVVPTEVRDTGEFLGSLMSRQSVSLQPIVGGYVRKILVRPGAQVQAGQSLLEIDARQEAAALDSARAQQQSASSSLELAERTLARTQQLYQEGLVSAQELEGAQASLQAAQASAQSSAASVSQRKVQLQFYEVKAPVAGTVGDVLVRVGDYVTAATQLTTVAQAEVLEVSIAVPAERARDVKVGMPVELLKSNGEVLLRSEVFFIAPQADGRSQLVDVKAVFPNTVGLRPNELVRTRLVYGVREALQVPALAVTRQSGQTFVFAVAEKEGQTVVMRKPVTLGPLGETSFVVEAGLSHGDRIATSSLQALRDGAAIKPRPAPPLAGRP